MKPQPVWVFGGVAGVLVVFLMFEWLWTPALPVVKVPSAPTVAQTDPDAPGRDTEHWAESVVNRPLFTIGRRPPHDKAGHAVVSTNGTPRLSGILIAGPDRHAIFVPEGGKAVTVAEGGSVDGYTVRTVRADSVTLSSPKGDVTLRLSFDKLRAFVNSVSPGPVFPNNGFNPGFNLGGGAPFVNPVQLPQQPQPPPPAGDDGDGAQEGAAPPQNPLPFRPGILPGGARPNLPRERE